ncbi:MAG: hypothetical protein Q7K44_03170 [Candidatus Liptonbacteria bacterium]|nr:hypothetical protein [Candidatus Liptonbacteria bacterium]
MKFTELKLKSSHASRNGQVMLVSILTLGAVMIGVTAVAGLLVVYQIRMSSDVANSAKAIFASDAGIDWALYQFLKPALATPDKRPVFSNGARFEVVCKNSSGNQVQCTDQSVSSIKSNGFYGLISRVFELNL